MKKYNREVQNNNSDTILDILEKQNILNPDKIAYTFLKYNKGECNEENITYKELLDKVKRLAAFLQENNMEGKQALLLFPDGIDFIIAFWGCLYAKVIAVPLYHFVSKRKAARLLGIIQDSKADIVLAGAIHINRLEKFMNTYESANTLKWCAIDKILERCSYSYQEVKVKQNELAYLQYTSGSTSQPKGVMITHKNIMHNMDLLHWYIGNHCNSVGVSWIPHYHDMGLIYAIIQPIYLGYRQILMEPSAFVGNPYRLLKAISDYHGTTLAMPNFAFDMCCDRITDVEKKTLDLSTLENAANGAEPVYAETMRRFVREFASCKVKKDVIIPAYGLAEATLIVSANDMQIDGSRVSILQVSRKKLENDIVSLNFDPHDAINCCCSGRLRDDVDIKIVNPQTLDKNDTNKIGEIWIASDSVSPGYWEKDNSEIFQAKIKGEGEKEYLRTGDLGFLYKNHLYITGRMKDVIIVRGANFYPNDIEYTVGRCHKDIVAESCAAFVVKNDAHDEQLIVAAELRREVSKKVKPNEVFDNIRKQVSEIHGLQLYGILLLRYGSIPKTSSGKIQRFLCKERYLNNELQILYSNMGSSISSEDSVEKKMSVDSSGEDILNKISSLLNIPLHELTSNRDLISLGLDSISMTVLKDYIENRYCCVELGFLFECTIEELLQFIQEYNGCEVQKNGSINLESWKDNEPYALTPLQNAYWMGRDEGFELGGFSAHVLVEVDSEKKLDYGRLNNAWKLLIRRHEMLRTIITSDGQQMANKAECTFDIVYHDLTNAEAVLQQDICCQIREQLTNQVFEIGKWPLFEIHFVDLGCSKSKLYFSIDLMIADIWSLDILFREWYQVYSNHERKLPELGVTFRDYCNYHFQHNKLTNTDAEKYWKNRISSLPQPPGLPIVKSPSEVKKVNFVHRTFELEKKIWTTIKNTARNLSITPSSVLLAVYAKILSIWSNSNHFSLNITMFNRRNEHKDIGNVVGDFTTVSVLEVDNTDTNSFSELARKIQKQLAKDMEFRDYSGIQIMRDLSTHWEKNPKEAILPIVFTSAVNQDMVFQNENHFFGKCKTISQTPQVYLDYQVYESNGKLSISWDSVDEIFPEDLVKEMFDVYHNLIIELAVSEKLWEEKIPSYLPESQKIKRAEYNNTKGEVSEDMLYSGFLRNIELNPNKLAIITDELKITYAELGNASFTIAEYLLGKGVKNGAVVPILMEKGWEQIAAAIGINMAGAVYVSIDPALPKERKEYIIHHCDADIIIAQSAPEDITINAEYFLVDSILLTSNAVRTISEYTSPDSLSYIIYTSGSTGIPKGVAITHKSALNTIIDINKRFSISTEDRIFAISSFSFDLSVYDFYGMLNAGGGIVLPKTHTERNPDYWIDMVNKYNVTIWNSVPSLFEMMVESIEVGKKNVEIDTVLLSGDWIPVNLPDRYRHIYSNARVVSLGGATEASIWSIFYEIEHVSKEWKSIPYGIPLSNQEYYVLNKDLGDCPDWVTGDLYIGGIGLAQEYYKEPDKTNEVFLTHPQTGERIYKTGDLGRFNSNNIIEFLGREDFQVKIGGFRIEIGEIESVINKHTDVQRTVVSKVANGESGVGLVAYIVPEKGSILCENNNYEAEIVSDNSEKILTEPRERLRFKLSNPAIQVKDDDPIWTQEDSDIHYLEYNERPDEYIKRISCRKFLNETVSKEDFSCFISMLKKTEIEGMKRYRYGSAGGVYPVQIYLYIKKDKVEGISEGIYYYHPHRNCLVLYKGTSQLSSEIHVEANKNIADGSAFTLFLVGKLSAIKPLYGIKSRDFCLVEAGLISQMLETAGSELGIGTCQIGVMGRMDIVSCALNLADDQELLHTMVAGKADITDITRGTQELKVQMDKTRERDQLKEEIKNLCAAKLPYYMIPSGIVLLDKIPLTKNGKVDYKKLPKVYMGTHKNINHAEKFSNKYEQIIYEVFRKKSGIDNLEMDTSFFDQGINSLTITRAWRELVEKTGKDFPVIRIFENPTIAAMAVFLHSLDRQNKKDDDNDDIMNRAKKQRRALRSRRTN